MSKSKKPAADYEVGYKRPPKKHQFKKGQINNTKGRPPGRVNPLAAALREAARLIQVRKGDAVETITRVDALMRLVSKMALGGDLAATRLFTNLLIQASADEQRRAEQRGGNPSEGAPLVIEMLTPELDEETVRRMARRFSHLATEEDKP